MAAKKRTLKSIDGAIVSAKKCIASYKATGNLSIVKHYEKHLADAMYIKSLIEKDMEL